MMQQLGFQLFDGPGGDMLADFGHAQRVEISDAEHGFEALSAFIPMTDDEAFRWYAAPGVPWAVLSAGWGTAWEGRVEDVAVVDGGLEIGALGAWRALSDAPYTALWSRTTTAGWRPVTSLDEANRTPERYELDNNNRLYLAIRNGETYTNVVNIGELTYAAPHNGRRDIVAFSARYDITLPTNWELRLLRWPADDFSVGATILQTITGTGANQTGVILQTFTGNPRIAVQIRNNTGSTYTMTASTGTYYARLTQIRITTTTANYVNTTLGTAVPPGTWTVTPASMANIYVGQSLIVAGAGGTEMVTVTGVTATTFTATFALAHGSSDPVVALVTYGGEVAAHLVSVINAINSDQLRNITALIQSPDLDLSDELYEDEWPQDVLTMLAQRGDREGNRYEVGVWENRTLHLRPRYSASRTWLVDALDLTVNRSMDNFRNQMYAVYRDANNRLKRTAVQTDGDPLEALDFATVPPFSRRGYINTRTTSQSQAEMERDIRITDTAVITPRAGFRVEALYDEQGGGPYPLWMARAGDLVIIRNLSPGLGTAVDRLRNFRIKRKRYIATEDVLELTPELELPDLAVMASESLTTADRIRPYTRIEG